MRDRRSEESKLPCGTNKDVGSREEGGRNRTLERNVRNAVTRIQVETRGRVLLDESEVHIPTH